MTEVRTCLWFAKDAEAAVSFYVATVAGSAIGHIQRAPTPWPGGRRGGRDLDQLHPRRSALPGAEWR
ncbi:MAG: VOC family protein [Caulobacteraceae bacterium]